MDTRYRSACSVSLLVFGVYLLTLSPSTAMWDAGEYLAAAKSLGVPHQPGNPMYGLAAHAFGLLPLSPSYAVRINVLAALASAIAAGFWFLCAERLLRRIVPDTVTRMAGAGACALLGAFAFTVWNQSVVMEKVYPLALVALALVAWLTLRWIDTTDDRRSDRLLILIAYLVGLGYAVHPAGLLTAPAVAAAAIRHRPRTLLRWKLLLVLTGAFLFGTTPFAMLPLRAAHQPFINESAVSACETGSIAASCTFSSETLRRLKGTIEREQYGGNPVLVRRAPFTAQVQMYWLYFKWQWLRDRDARFVSLQSLVAATMLMLGLFGLTALKRSGAEAPANGRARISDAPAFWFFATLTATFTIALIYYLNFRYGFSQSPELANTVEREPRDRDYFYMWTFSLWGLLAGLGLTSFAATLKPARLRVAVLGLALLPLAGNWTDASRKGQSFSREWAVDMLNSVEPNGVLITNGDNDSFPLWYAQAVEGIRQDVTVALTPYLDMDWYARQLNLRAKLWKLSNQELDTIPPYIELRQPVQFEHGPMQATIPPGYLTRGQLLVLRAIKDSFPSRPIYFSFGPYPQQLGLGEYVKRVGLVQKLESRPVREDPDSVRTPLGYMDVAKSLALWKTYRAPAQLLKEGRWVDSASSDVPFYYAIVGQELALALESRGDSASARQVIALARQAADVAK